MASECSLETGFRVELLVAAIPNSRRVLVVGVPEEFHVGAHFVRAAPHVGCEVSLEDSSGAYGRPRLLQSLVWRINRRPLHLRKFGRRVIDACRRERPSHLLATGIAPLCAADLRSINHMGIVTMIFLTDDPWSRSHRASWFMDALTEYAFVFSPRQQNLTDLGRHGCARVHYLPFGFCPEMHRWLGATTGDDPAADVLFVGGADGDRVPYVRALVAAGLWVELYGSGWGRLEEFRPLWKGHADLDQQRRITPSAKIVLGLVRRANRDGHAMRSYEVPAMGGCMLTEDTPEHREMFGAEGECTVYFQSLTSMVEKARWLLEHEDERRRLAAAAHARITGGRNTYADRLETMLRFSSPAVAVVR